MTLTLASMQFSPRILISFVRDRGTQWTLGIFLGTFSYRTQLPVPTHVPAGKPFIAAVRPATSDIMLADQRQDPSGNARAASVSSEAVPADLLTIRAPAPDWFRRAISHPGQSQFVMVAGCRIHYLHWAREPARPGERGVLDGNFIPVDDGVATSLPLSKSFQGGILQ
jgi:hypothetical protein